MGLFSRREGFPRKRALELNLTNILVLVILTFVFIQGLGLLLASWFDVEAIKLGPVFILIAVAMCASTSIAIFKKLVSDQAVSKQDIFAIIVTALIAILMLFFLRDFVPEIFEQSILQLQSVIGF